MRTARIAAQVRPVGRRRVDLAGAPPGNRLAASRHNGPHPRRHRIARIDGEKIQIALQRISLQRRDISILIAEIPDGLRADRGNLIVCECGGRRVRRAIEEYKRRVDLGGMPRHLAAFGHVVDAQTNLIEHPTERQPPGPDHLGKGLGIGAIRPRFLRSHRARGGIESDHYALVRLHERQAAGKGLAGFREGVRARRVENDDVDLQFERFEGPDVIGHAHRLDRDVAIACDPCIDRHKVVFAFELNAVAAEIDKCDGVGTGRRRFVQEIVQRAAQGILIQIAGADDIKARGLKRLRDQTRIVRRGRQRRRLISAVADHKRDPLFRLLRACDRRKSQRGDRQNQLNELAHGVLSDPRYRIGI